MYLESEKKLKSVCCIIDFFLAIFKNFQYSDEIIPLNDSFKLEQHACEYYKAEVPCVDFCSQINNEL